jgi:hypothetical protein
MLPERALQISTIVVYSVPWSPYCESNRKITAIVCMYLRAVPGVHSTAGRGPKQQHTEHRQSSAVDHTAATNARPGLAELLRPIRDTPDPDVERFEPIRANVRTHMSGAMYSLTTP